MLTISSSVFRLRTLCPWLCKNTIAGTLELRKAICQRMKADCGVEYEPSQVVVSNGAKSCVYQALRALRQLREPAFFETWLTRIVLNACHRELRRRKRLAGEEALPDTAGPDAYDALPLKEAVRRLPEDLRAVVILRYFAGYTQAETARALNIPQGTAATRQRRALQLLRLELGEEGDP